jgi:hypothetical protein
VQLFAGDGTPLALGLADPVINGAAIRDFVAPDTGTYVARVTAARATDYRLLITREIGFEQEPNGLAVQARPLGVTAGVLGPQEISGVHLTRNLFTVDVGVDIEGKIGGELRWTQPEAPPVQWRLPDSGAFVAAVGVDVFGEGNVLNKYTASLKGAIQVTADVYPNPRVTGLTGGFTFEAVLPSIWTPWGPTPELCQGGMDTAGLEGCCGQRPAFRADVPVERYL